jgi:hypothetical protein
VCRVSAFRRCRSREGEGRLLGRDVGTYGLSDDVEDHVLVALIAADADPERAPITDADGQGGLAFERAGERDCREGSQVGDLLGCDQALRDLWRRSPGLVTLVVGAVDGCPDLPVKPTVSGGSACRGPLMSNTTRW